MAHTYFAQNPLARESHMARGKVIYMGQGGVGGSSNNRTTCHNVIKIQIIQKCRKEKGKVLSLVPLDPVT